MYAPSSRSGYRSPNLPLFSSSLTLLDDFPKTAAAAIKGAYPECFSKYLENLDLGCIYTNFILNHLSPDNDLLAAFAAAENKKVKIILALGYSYIDSGAVAVDITTDNASIAAFLLGNGGVKNK